MGESKTHLQQINSPFDQILNDNLIKEVITNSIYFYHKSIRPIKNNVSHLFYSLHTTFMHTHTGKTKNKTRQEKIIGKASHNMIGYLCPAPKN